tara:strand:+ start:856 stop:1173 length:318 start_codon:yes stop_codon:yes gene_type:complete
METNEQKMEFIPETLYSEPVRWNSDFTILPTGEHQVGMSMGDADYNIPINVERNLDTVHIKYSHDNHEYTHVIHPDGRKYTHVKFLGNERESSREWEEKGMWRFY